VLPVSRFNASGKGRAALEIFRGVAVPLELRQHIALGVVGVLILDLGRFVVELEGISVHRLEEVALGVIGILLDPAVGIGQLDGAVAIIVDIGIGAVIRVNDAGEVIHRIVEAAGLAAVRIGNAGLIAHGVIGVGNRVAFVVGHLLEAAQQVQLEGVGAGPVIHLHQFADLVILVGDLLCPIVIDFLHQIKGGVGILRHIAVRVGLGDQIAVAVVDINGTVAKRVDLLRDQIPTIVLIQRDLVGVHAIEGIHTVEVGGNELVILIVGKYGLRAQCIDGLYNVSIAIIDIPCGIAVAVLDLHDAVCGIIGE